jgi:ribosomal protein S27AE
LVVIGPREEEKVREVLREGHVPECPRCGDLLQITPIPRRSDVSYVRDRVLLACGPCDLTVAVDNK